MSEDFLLGPFTEYRVLVDGRVIPHLTGGREPDGRVNLFLDGRWGVTFPDEETARQAAFLIANALAIGQGYSHLGTETKDQPFAPKAMRLDVPPNLHLVPSSDDEAPR